LASKAIGSWPKASRAADLACSAPALAVAAVALAVGAAAAIALF
jgi:hypothetical protein